MDAVKSAGRSRTEDGGEAHESTKGELKQVAWETIMYQKTPSGQRLTMMAGGG